MNLTYFYPKMRGNVVNNSPANIRFVAKISEIRMFSENIRSDVKTSEVATLCSNSDREAADISAKGGSRHLCLKENVSLFRHRQFYRADVASLA